MRFLFKSILIIILSNSAFDIRGEDAEKQNNLMEAMLSEKYESDRGCVDCDWGNKKQIEIKLMLFKNSDFSGSNFDELIHVYFYMSNLEKSDFSNVNSSSSFQEIKDYNLSYRVKKADDFRPLKNRSEILDFITKECHGCNLFAHSRLSNSDFSKALMPHSVFNRSSLRNSNFKDAGIYNSIFKNSDLNNAIFIGSDLSSSCIIDSNLTKSDFTGAILSNALIGTKHLYSTSYRFGLYDVDHCHNLNTEFERLQKNFRVNEIAKISYATPEEILDSHGAHYVFSDVDASGCKIFQDNNCLKFLHPHFKNDLNDIIQSSVSERLYKRWTKYLEGYFDQFYRRNPRTGVKKYDHFYYHSHDRMDAYKGDLRSDASGASFRNITAKNSIFDGKFTETNFKGAVLSGAILAGNFNSSNFISSDLSSSHLIGSFVGVNFTNSDLTNSQLDANFTDANFTDVNFTDAKLGDDAIFCNTVMPYGVENKDC